ncbi:MAG: histidine phosphatase family protein [Acidibacillus sp.]|uniref:Phosphoserine phosphatase 1 n=1 Tax=Sulfoacidibacillus ferrooxidans TaxID=2005001 RepID=A0A9X2ABK6_9BACL|nr:histidine phosphatase family protein [Sulfoacidibacillus ferrooxidans]MCI0183113.1 Phosphoserine phosphatase 1 [Sulfoacidibacillus ferrooxidans]MCY0893177.1 histidine phosphatase family protein [Acidibacillus sp.]
MKTTLCLMRHGETDWNVTRRFQGRTDVPLNDRGREQALRSALFLSQGHYEHVVSSPLLRAKETAEIIANELQMGTVTVIDELAERDAGSGTGLTLEEYKNADAQSLLSGVESHDDVRNRAMKVLYVLCERFEGRRIIVVSHGAVINAVLAELSGGEVGTGKTILQNVCLNTLHFHHNRWEIESYNRIDHLRKKNGDMLGSLSDDLDVFYMQ